MSHTYFAHKSGTWVGLTGDNLYALLGDSCNSHPAGRLGAVIIWRLARSCLLVGEASVGSDGQNICMCLLRVATWLPEKTEARFPGWACREIKPGGSNIYCLLWAYLEVTEGHFCCFLLGKEVINFCPVSRGAERLHWLMGEWQSSGRAYGTGNRLWLFFGTSSLTVHMHIAL